MDDEILTYRASAPQPAIRGEIEKASLVTDARAGPTRLGRTMCRTRMTEWDWLQAALTMKKQGYEKKQAELQNRHKKH
ncbi:hypothetical protein [Acanthopleuribacter pedis]|uniref:Uncharacterized protein n=1 Tax=Acanthopleuribacter pedis TaxID=442870 RepID=A0A8J7Q655_9BACT|nr:hypothetical protein [Acanthopleuribacter pedis]MBO1319680.1 hypothetical protein [Acanthopleuribacter pedis]